MYIEQKHLQFCCSSFVANAEYYLQVLKRGDANVWYNSVTNKTTNVVL